MEKYKIIVILLFAGLAISNGAMANQQLITFDSIVDGLPNIPSGYAGMTWNNIEILNNGLSNVGFTTSNGAGSFSDANPFTLYSIDLAIQVPSTMEIIGSLNGVQEYSQILTLSNILTPETFNWTNINKVTINVGGGWNVVMDNILINSQNNVPEPTSIALLASGLIGFSASRRKKNPA